MLAEAISEVHLEQTTASEFKFFFPPFLEPFEPERREGEKKREKEEEEWRRGGRKRCKGKWQRLEREREISLLKTI